MRFAQFLLLDIRSSFRECAVFSGAFAVMIAAAVSALWLTSAAYGIDWACFTLGDNLVGILGGMRQVEPGLQITRYRLPGVWLLMILLVAYAPLTYPYRNLMGFGKQIVVAGGSRRLWWMAKCAWVVLYVSVLCVIAFCVVAAMTACVGADLSLAVSGGSLDAVDVNMADLVEPPWDVIPFLVMVPAVLVCLCVVQLALSLVIRPVLSFVVTLSILMVSLYSSIPALLGSYLMAARTSCLFVSGFDVSGGITLCVVISCFAVAAGLAVFDHMDIMSKEFNA